MAVYQFDSIVSLFVLPKTPPGRDETYSLGVLQIRAGPKPACEAAKRNLLCCHKLKHGVSSHHAAKQNQHNNVVVTISS
jgi:hypothetical protein